MKAWEEPNKSIIENNRKKKDKDNRMIQRNGSSKNKKINSQRIGNNDAHGLH